MRTAISKLNQKYQATIPAPVRPIITGRTNAPWPLDIPIEDLVAAGLPAPSVVRMKLFTRDHKLILRKAGRFALEDQQIVRAALANLLRFTTSD